MTSTRNTSERFSIGRRLAIAGCLAIGCLFTFRAATSEVAATSVTQSWTQADATSHVTSPDTRASDSTLAATVNDSLAFGPLTTKNIEHIQPGDLVLARDEHGTEVALKPVKEVYRRTSDHLRHLTFEARDGTRQTLSTTDEHHFWSVTAEDFVESVSLSVGHRVTGPDGNQQTLVASTREEFPTGVPVFNFQVGDFHTYYVRASSADAVVLVHNDDCGLTTEQILARARAQDTKLPEEIPVIQDWNNKMHAYNAGQFRANNAHLTGIAGFPDFDELPPYPGHYPPLPRFKGWPRN